MCYLEATRREHIFPLIIQNAEQSVPWFVRQRRHLLSGYEHVLYFNLLSVTKTILQLKELDFNLVLAFPEERKEVAKKARI